MATSNKQDWDDISSGVHPILQLFKTRSDPTGKTNVSTWIHKQQKKEAVQPFPITDKRSGDNPQIQKLSKETAGAGTPTAGVRTDHARTRGDP